MDVWLLCLMVNLTSIGGVISMVTLFSHQHLIDEETIVSTNLPSVGVVIPSRNVYPSTLAYLTDGLSDVFVSTVNGLGKARNFGVSQVKGELIVMFDDDLVVYPKFWNWLATIKLGSFGMALNVHSFKSLKDVRFISAHCCSQVFVIHRVDFFKVGGFDDGINLIFEDGDFCIRALNYGLKLRVVPSNCYSHVAHKSRATDPSLIAKFSWEYSRLFVKYGRFCYEDLAKFFVNPRDYRVFLPHFIVKVVGVIFFVFKKWVGGLKKLWG